MDSHKKLCTLLFFVLEGSWFFAMNVLTPLLSDDWTMTAESLDFVEIAKRLYHHYSFMNGRVVAHFFVFFFLSFGKWLFNIANTVVFLVFSHVVFFHATYGTNIGNKTKAALYVLMHALLFVFCSYWGEIFLWVDGACNYLWTCTLMLLFLIPFRKAAFALDEKACGKLKCVCIFLLGVLAGWCNENTSGGTILLAIIFTSVYWCKKHRPRAWMVSGLCGAVLGFGLMVFAPGNSARINYLETKENVSPLTGLDQFLARFRNITRYLLDNFEFILLTLVGLAVLMMLMRAGRGKFVIFGSYALAGIATSYALILSAYTPGRSFFGASVFLIISLVSALSAVSSESRTGKFSVAAMACVFSILFLNRLFWATNGIVNYSRENRERTELIEKKVSEGYDNIVVYNITPLNEYVPAYGINDLQENPETWPNASIAEYYEIQSITAVPRKTYLNVFENGDEVLINCVDFADYLSLLKNPEYLVVISLKGSFANAKDAEFLAFMRDAGLKADLQNGAAYLAILDGGKAVYEGFGGEVVEHFGNYYGHHIEAESRGEHAPSYSEAALIDIDGVEYSANLEGINIVVMDKGSGRVVDRVAFENNAALR